MCLNMLREDELRECPGGGQDEEGLTGLTRVREVIQGWGNYLYKSLKMRENLVYSRNCKYLRIVWSEVEWKSLSCATLWDPMDYAVHGILQARILEWVAFPFSRRSSQPRDQTQVSHRAGDFFTSWATGKPKSTGVGSLSLFWQIFLTEELTQGLLHYRWILYQLR